MIFNYVKGKNVLHMVRADMAVFTPEHTLGAIVKRNANLRAGSDFVEEAQGTTGNSVVIANAERYKADALLLIQAMSKQFAAALRKGL